MTDDESLDGYCGAAPDAAQKVLEKRRTPLTREGRGITARCKCGWVSGGHFTSLAASAALQDHKERCGQPHGESSAGAI